MVKQASKNVFRITGGLGNQMCQYAFMYQRGKKKGVSVALDTTAYRVALWAGYVIHNGYELERIFGIKQSASLWEIVRSGGWLYYAMVIARKLKLISKVKSKGNVCVENNPTHSYTYIPEYQENNCTYFQGFFENYQYYDQYLDELQEIFTFPGYINEANKVLAQEMQNYNSVGIHLRRNDKGAFFHNGDAGGIDYYKKAIAWIHDNVADPQLYIFSNDPEWCKILLQIEGARYVSHNSGDEAFRDMQLLSECRYIITANSTFSLWAGLLKKQKEGAVLCPKVWNTSREGHPAPREWIRI